MDDERKRNRKPFIWLITYTKTSIRPHSCVQSLYLSLKSPSLNGRRRSVAVRKSRKKSKKTAGINSIVSPHLCHVSPISSVESLTVLSVVLKPLQQTEIPKIPSARSRKKKKTNLFLRWSNTPFHIPSKSRTLKMESTAITKSMSLSPATMMLTSGALRSLVVLLQGLLLMLLLPFRWGYVLQGRRSVERSSKDGKVVVRVPAAMVPQRIVRGEQDEALARRAMAIERVRETDGGDVRRGYSVFVTSRGEGLFTQSWAPVLGDIKFLK